MMWIMWTIITRCSAKRGYAMVNRSVCPSVALA